MESEKNCLGMEAHLLVINSKEEQVRSNTRQKASLDFVHLSVKEKVLTALGYWSVAKAFNKIDRKGFLSHSTLFFCFHKTELSQNKWGHLKYSMWGMSGRMKRFQPEMSIYYLNM